MKRRTMEKLADRRETFPSMPREGWARGKQARAIVRNNSTLDVWHDSTLGALELMGYNGIALVGISAVCLKNK